MLLDVLDLETEPIVKRLADHKARCVERVREHLVEGEVEPTGGRLVAHEHDDRLHGRSSISISAEPGPAPRMLPEKASVSRSCPAPYSFSFFASAVPLMKVSQASLWICSLSSPRLCVMIKNISSPQCEAWPSINRPDCFAASSSRWPRTR